MERNRSPIDDLGVLAAIATGPLVANALLTANALAAEDRHEESPEGREGRSDAPDDEPEEPKRSLFDRIDAWFWRLEQRDLEARLAEATDIYDLEVRIRGIERGAPWWSH